MGMKGWTWVPADRPATGLPNPSIHKGKEGKTVFTVSSTLRYLHVTESLDLTSLEQLRQEILGSGNDLRKRSSVINSGKLVAFALA